MIVYTYMLAKPGDLNIDPKSLSRALPREMRAKCLRFRRQADQYNCIIGKLLLKELLVKFFGQNKSCLERLYKNAYDKLYLNEDIDFNISHSANMVVCVVSDEGEIGIDVEKKLDFDPENIAPFLQPEELTYLKQQNNSHTFYELWTKKESLLKAKGLGLSLDLKLVKVNGDEAILDAPYHERWFYYSLKTHRDYITTICFGKADAEITYLPFTLHNW